MFQKFSFKALTVSIESILKTRTTISEINHMFTAEMAIRAVYWQYLLIAQFSAAKSSIGFKNGLFATTHILYFILYHTPKKPVIAKTNQNNEPAFELISNFRYFSLY